jgi:hypothetical protein
LCTQVVIWKIFLKSSRVFGTTVSLLVAVVVRRDRALNFAVHIVILDPQALVAALGPTGPRGRIGGSPISYKAGEPTAGVAGGRENQKTPPGASSEKPSSSPSQG